ncbi:hypothetical protein B5G91_12585 [Listeria monocytogenes]|nr:hypothetical protein [Listeria monocytogenes]
MEAKDLLQMQLVDTQTGELIKKEELHHILSAHNKQTKAQKETLDYFNKVKAKVDNSKGFVTMQYDDNTFKNVGLPAIGHLFRLGLYVPYKKEGEPAYIKKPKAQMPADLETIAKFLQLDKQKTRKVLDNLEELGFLAEDKEGFYFKNDLFYKGKVEQSKPYKKRFLIENCVQLYNNTVELNNIKTANLFGCFLLLCAQTHATNLIVAKEYQNSLSIEDTINQTDLALEIGISKNTLGACIRKLKALDYEVLTVLSEVQSVTPRNNKSTLYNLTLINPNLLIADRDLFEVKKLEEDE